MGRADGGPDSQEEGPVAHPAAGRPEGSAAGGGSGVQAASRAMPASISTLRTNCREATARCGDRTLFSYRRENSVPRIFKDRNSGGIEPLGGAQGEDCDLARSEDPERRSPETGPAAGV